MLAPSNTIVTPWHGHGFLSNPRNFRQSSSASKIFATHHSILESHASDAGAENSTYEVLYERGTAFITGPAFYRAESAQGRDLAVLAAAVYKRKAGSLKVLDVMAGSGVRGVRYLQQAAADAVWCNDADPRLHDVLVTNLCGAAGLHDSAGRCCVDSQDIHAKAQAYQATAHTLRPPGLKRDVWEWLPHQQQGNSHNQQQLPAATSQLGGGSPQNSELNAAALPNESMHKEDSILQGVDHMQGISSKVPIDTSEFHSPAAAGAVHNDSLLSSTEASQHVDAGENHGACEQGNAHRSTSHSSAAPSIRVSHIDANRLLASCYLQEEFYDLVDVDSFGSDTSHFASAINTVKFGGLLYLTSTDGLSSGGHRPERSLAAYGSYLRAMPDANEQGLRMIIGAAVREAAAHGIALQPLFSLYSYHGPVFRVMLRAKRSLTWPHKHYGFLGHCFVHGDNYVVDWRQLSSAVCRCCGKPIGHDMGRGKPLVLSGPMWTGPLHDREFLLDMQSEAAARGWAGHSFGGSGGSSSSGSGSDFDSKSVTKSILASLRSKKNSPKPLEHLLEVMVEEAGAQLPPGFFLLDTIARHLTSYPARDALIKELRARGFAASCCHLDARAIRTNARMAQILEAAEGGLGLAIMPGSAFASQQHTETA